ncbi:MAG: 6,7-dimethyl-8-ribityllumazine synthase [Planctomycetota bacterium]
MVRTLEGHLQATGLRFAIVVSRFNEFISSRLLSGALDAIRRHGAKNDDVTVAWVPGSFELPLLARKLAGTGEYDAVICLGAVIRGATPHYEYVAEAAARGIAETALATGVPIVFGVLTCETIEQAIERAGSKAGNKGFHAAMAAIETANLLRSIG